MPDFRYLQNEAELGLAYDLMRELRPHLADRTAFVEQIGRQFDQHYRLLSAWQGSELVGLAGFRSLENLLYGQFIYVDDLVVDPAQRQNRLGAQLLDAVRAEAVMQGCAHLVLDTGLHRPLAQRFYYREGLLAKGLHFVRSLSAVGD